MKSKFLIAFLTVLLLISVFSFTVFAEDDVLYYQDIPNQMTYFELHHYLLEGYPGSYCVMESYGIFTFYYPETAPDIVTIETRCDGDYFAMGFPNPVCVMDEYGEYRFGFSVNLDANRSFKLVYPYFVGDLFGGEFVLDFEVDASNWQPFQDVASVPTEPPPGVEIPVSGGFASILGEMIDILVGGIPSIAGYIGDGLSTLAAAIFLTGTGDTMKLSVFGGTIIIFAGVALAIGLSKFVVGWLTSLGASD